MNASAVDTANIQGKDARTATVAMFVLPHLGRIDDFGTKLARSKVLLSISESVMTTGAVLVRLLLLAEYHKYCLGSKRDGLPLFLQAAFIHAFITFD
jgi:hypothetical protein